MQTARAIFLAAALLTTLGASAASLQEQAEATRQVSARYLAADAAGRFDELEAIYAPDAVFTDPTGDVFKGPVAEGPIKGSKTIVAQQKSWRLAEQVFAVRGAFAVGDIALHHGELTVRYDGAEKKYAIPFVTVHRVSDGRIAERIDFGEYIKSFGLGDGYAAATASTKTVAEQYLQAYLAADIEGQAALCADGIVFQDMTAKVFGEAIGQPIAGRDTIMQRRKETFANVKDFGLEIKESFVANHHAVFIGTTKYTVGGRKWAQPAVFVIEVRDGKVARHWDFVDYTVGPIG